MEVGMMAIIDYRPVRWIPVEAAETYHYPMKTKNGHETLKKMLVEILMEVLPENPWQRLRLLHDLISEDPWVAEEVYQDTYEV